MLDYNHLQELTTLGFLKEVQHPKYPELFLYDYTRKTEERNKWNNTTLNCRGTVIRYNEDWSTSVISKPFQKFFNEDDFRGMEIFGVKDYEKIEITKKLDGSMIVVSEYQGDLIVNTRGSFDSWQAKRAKELLNEKYPKTKEMILKEKALTFLFEFTSPENLVVLPYQEECLTLIGTNITRDKSIIQNENNELSLFEKEGEKIASKLDTPKVKNYKNETLENIKGLDNEEEEGFVINYIKNQFIVKREKIKFNSYVSKHQTLASLTDRTIIKLLVEGHKKGIENLKKSLPQKWEEHINKVKTIEQKEETLLKQNIEEALKISQNMTNKEVGLTKEIPNEIKSFVFLKRKGATDKYKKHLQDKIIEKSLKNLQG